MKPKDNQFTVADILIIFTVVCLLVLGIWTQTD